MKFWVVLVTATILLLLTINITTQKRLNFTPPPDELTGEISPRRVLGERFPSKCARTDELDVLLDKTYGIPEDYVPENLVAVSTKGIPTINNNLQLKNEAADALATMLSEMKQQNLSFMVYSAFRSSETQKQTYLMWLKQLGERAEKRSALPGHSEHQLGTAVDIALENGNYLYPSPAWNWLDQNAQNFGFVMSYRYPQTEGTGYDFEPWHWRYVGVNLATEIRASGDLVQNHYRKLCLN